MRTWPTRTRFARRSAALAVVALLGAATGTRAQLCVGDMQRVGEVSASLGTAPLPGVWDRWSTRTVAASVESRPTDRIGIGLTGGVFDGGPFAEGVLGPRTDDMGRADRGGMVGIAVSLDLLASPTSSLCMSTAPRLLWGGAVRLTRAESLTGVRRLEEIPGGKYRGVFLPLSLGYSHRFGTPGEVTVHPFADLHLRYTGSFFTRTRGEGFDHSGDHTLPLARTGLGVRIGNALVSLAWAVPLDGGRTAGHQVGFGWVF